MKMLLALSDIKILPLPFTSFDVFMAENVIFFFSASWLFMKILWHHYQILCCYRCASPHGKGKMFAKCGCCLLQVPV